MPNTGNTSATGGYLDPESTPAVDDDKAFRDFIREVILGIVSTLPRTLVWAAYQKNPPTQPDLDVDWCAFHVGDSDPDFDSSVQQVPAPTEGDDDRTMQQHTSAEAIQILVSFYGPNCKHHAGILRDGLRVEPNRAALYSAGVGLTDVSRTTRVPEKAGELFCDRADITLTVSREVRRVYPVLHFLAAQGTTKANRGTEVVPVNWTTGEPTP